MKITIQQVQKISGWAGLLLGPILMIVNFYAYLHWEGYRQSVVEGTVRALEGGIGHPVLLLINLGFLLLFCWFCLTVFVLGRAFLRRVRRVRHG